MPNELFTRKEVAYICGVIPHTIYFWEKKGLITATAYFNGRPRYSRDEVERVAKERQIVFFWKAKSQPNE